MNMINMHEISADIADLPRKLRECAQPMRFLRGQTVMRKGEPTQYAYLLLSGDMAVLNDFQDGTRYSFAHICVGRYLGDLEVLSEKEINAASVIALKESLVLRFPIESFKETLREDILFLRTVAHGMAVGMFRSTSERGYNHYRRGTDRLIRLLIKYYALYCPQSGGTDLTVARTHQDIANEIGVCVKTVDRSVKALRDEGVIRIERGKIHLDEKTYAALCARSEEIN